MAKYEKKYNPDRGEDWNYGGNKWRLSRSKIDLFIECPRCFYLDNKLGTARPKYPAFTLNVAVDALLKKEFDIHRVGKTRHPLLEQYGVEAIPFEHPKMDIWRDNFKGLSYHYEPADLVVSGAVDDIWINKKEELIVVDYKATSKDGKIESLADSSWEEQYKRQIGVYQWLLAHQEDFKVSKTGYFVYANASKEEEAFDKKLIFDVTLIPMEGDTTWIEPTLHKVKECLEGKEIPPKGEFCEYCMYREASGKKLQEIRHAQKGSN